MQNPEWKRSPHLPRWFAVAFGLWLCLASAACLTRQPESAMRHGWWQGLGPVLPHDSFPTDCSLCHLGGDWQTLRSDFEFNHELETGVALTGAHVEAQCIRCHNDRGPVVVFAERGCAGCHEDIHLGGFGGECTECHGELDWTARGMFERHFQTRFPLVGVHAATDCRRCHPGFEVGRIQPADVECVSCHGDDLAGATDPNHVNLGYVDRCDRCHTPTDWHQVSFQPND